MWPELKILTRGVNLKKQPPTWGTLRKTAWRHSLELRDSHRVLARACITHLLFDDFNQDPLKIFLPSDSSEQLRMPRFLSREMKDYIVGWIGDLFKQKCRLHYPRSDIQDEPPSDNVDRETESTESSVSSKSDISPHALGGARSQRLHLES